jgi:hypothetical protein
MATLFEYFSSDFSSGLKFDQPMSLTITEVHSGEVTKVDFKKKVILDDPGSTRLMVFYIQETELVEEICSTLIRDYDKIVEESLGLDVIGGYVNDMTAGLHKTVFSRRIYFYSENELSSEALARLNTKATEQELFITIRSLQYQEKRNTVNKPLAFISHDSKDKEHIARPIAQKLSSRLCTVWYDEYSMKVGDSLRNSIEKGIKETKKCIIILTPNFLNNPGWTKKEFESIFTREMIFEEKIILPIWHKVTKEEVYEYSPSLADTVALIWPDKDNLESTEYEKQVEALVSKLHTAIQA